MKRVLDLSQLSVPQLLEIRRILAGGVEASASKAGDEARKLRKENAELKRESEWRVIVESYNLEWGEDSSYWLSFATEARLRWVCEKMSNAKKEASIAEATRSVLRIPPIIAPGFKGDIEIVREGLQNRRNGKSED